MFRKNGETQKRSHTSVGLGWRWFRRCCLAAILLTMGACGTFPSDVLELAPVQNGKCNPILQLQNNKMYQVKDIKTGATTQPYAALFKKGEEWGCLVSMWTDRQASNEANKAYVTMVKLTPDGKLSSLEPIGGNETPVLHIPSDKKLSGFHFLLYIIKPAVVVPTQGQDLTKIQSATDNQRAGLTAEERKIRIGLDTLKEMCRVADSTQYNCFGKNREDCQFFFKLYPTTSKLPDVNKTLAKDSEQRSCVLCAPEICNGLDDDCDGQVDNMRDPSTGEALKDSQGNPRPLSVDCYEGKGQDLVNVEQSKGICKAGKRTCVSGKWSKCAEQKLPKKEICNGIDDDCDGRNDETNEGPLCPPGQACEGGACKTTKCRPGQTECAVGKKKLCFNLSNTQKHCGSCSKACGTGEVCVGGKCGLVCPPGLTKCGNQCSDLLKDPLNCGGCGKNCKNSEVCAAGKCGLICPPGLTKCGNRCFDLKIDPLNCGKCDKSCSPGQVCVNKACSLICPTGLQKCGGLCVDFKTNARHCSACNKTCGPSEICAAGKCGLVCPPGLTKCGASCVNITKDATHCSGCNKLCKPAEVCVKSVCSIICPPPQKKCGSVCVDWQTNGLNCGKCGNACSNGEKCIKGVCKLDCPPGQAACGSSCCSPGQSCCKGNVCADPKASQSYCGCSASSVGTNCTSKNQLCKNGACTLVCPAGQAACGNICCGTKQTCCKGNVCVDPKTDPKRCGCTTSSDGKNCASSNEACSAGVCKSVCPGGSTKCGASCCPSSKVCCSGNLCVDPKTDPKSCGCTPSSGGTDCSTKNLICSGGTCGCPAGQSLCGSTCVDKQTDRKNCGSCGKTCALSQTCVSGGCTCPTGQSLCGVACVDKQTDRTNCGSCGKTCGANETCVAGVCRCPSGQSSCGGVCVNTQTDSKNCGSCGKTCGANETCAAGVCSCPSGQTRCGTTCVDLQTDRNHCGTCNKKCAGTIACKAGTCGELFLNSKLLNNAQMAKINNWVGTPSQVWTLCYRFTRDGGKPSTFHTNCGGKGPSLTVALLKDGKRIGGYASVSWLSTGKGSFGDAKSFLFSLTTDFKYEYFRWASYLYRDGNKLGPAWGAGLDWLSGGNPMNKGMYCKVGASYKCNITDIAKCRADFCGTSPELADMEVFLKK